LPRTNLLKIGIATAAAAVGATLAITSVFAHSAAPSTSRHSLVAGIVSAAQAASIPVSENEPASNALIAEEAADAAELAAKIAAEQAEAAKAAAEAAAQAADADDVDVEVEEDVEDPSAAPAATTQAKVEKTDTGDHQTD
jgi:hypothetical protein